MKIAEGVKDRVEKLEDGTKTRILTPLLRFSSILGPSLRPSWAHLWPQDRPKMAPRRPQDGSRWPQDGPRLPKDRPRSAQDREGWVKIAKMDSRSCLLDRRRRANAATTIGISQFSGARMAQDSPKKAPRSPKDGPKIGPRRVHRGSFGCSRASIDPLIYHMFITNSKP